MVIRIALAGALLAAWLASASADESPRLVPYEIDWRQASQSAVDMSVFLKPPATWYLVEIHR
jgi:hypothetical protein